MAICVPAKPEFETRGEKKVFSLLKRLPDTCLVYYEMMIGQRDRRPDFVVIDKERGITLLEVKDWGIDTIKTASRRAFKIVTKQNRERKALNPEVKLKMYLEDVREQLYTESELCDERGRLKVPVRYYVVFPNMSRDEFEERNLGAVISPERVLFSENLKSIDGFKAWYNQNEKTGLLSSGQLNAIRRALFPETVIPGSEQWFSEQDKVGPVVLEDEIQEFGLDIYQEQIAKSLGKGPRFLHGIAGTGKTLILLFHAKMTSANNRALGIRSKSLILCWNISLAQYMRHAYSKIQIEGADQVEIMHFSAFARRLLRRHPGVRFPKAGDPDFDDKLTRALESIPISEDEKYDTIYIDEAQDFQKDWIKFIFDKMLRGEPKERNLIIAGDYAQHIYKYRDFSRSSGFTWKSIGIPMVGRTRTLKKIYRNSARVWSYAAAFLGNIGRYYDGTTNIEFAPKRGFDPQLIKCSSIDEQIDKAVDIVSKLSEHNYSPRNAMILYRWSHYKGYPVVENLIARLQEKGVPYQWITEDNVKKATFDWAEESVKISTVHSAKGMDAPVVIILGAEAFRERADNMNDEEKLLYVALTRAREFLVILYSGATPMIERLEKAMSVYRKYRSKILFLEKKAREGL